MNREELTNYIAGIYAVRPDYPWEGEPTYAVFRHARNRKWFALILEVPKRKLRLDEEGSVDVVNLKCDPRVIGSLRGEKGFFPAYHMNKDHWITAALDGTADADKIRLLLDMSFDLTAKQGRKQRPPAD